MAKIFHVTKHVEMIGGAYVRADDSYEAEDRADELDIEAYDEADVYYEVDGEYEEDDLPAFIDKDEILDL